MQPPDGISTSAVPCDGYFLAGVCFLSTLTTISTAAGTAASHITCQTRSSVRCRPLCSTRSRRAEVEYQGTSFQREGTYFVSQRILVTFVDRCSPPVWLDIRSAKINFPSPQPSQCPLTRSSTVLIHKVGLIICLWSSLSISQVLLASWGIYMAHIFRSKPLLLPSSKSCTLILQRGLSENGL